MKYGITYQGGKNEIALDIIKVLPEGKRFVDLFGGGFAISHCALLSGKWSEVYYNDIDPLLADLFNRVFNGEFKDFKPEFITREMFHELKTKDGYVKFIWSFGVDGESYLYGEDIEEHKRQYHNLVVFGEDAPLLNELTGMDLKKEMDNHFSQNTIFSIKPTLRKKRLYARKLIKSNTGENLEQLERLQSLVQLQSLQSLVQLERLESLERSENLQRLERLQRQRLTLNSHCYQEYEYKQGDVVYCDIPYEGTKKYVGNEFNHKEFYEWARSRPYEVYFSSYDIGDKDFHVIMEKPRKSTMQGGTGETYIEKVYANHYNSDRAVNKTVTGVNNVQCNIFEE